MAAALALARSRASVSIFAPQPASGTGSSDRRTAALFAGSIDFLKRLGVWAECAPASAPITAIRIIDDTGSLFRAPEVLFEARELGLDAFGYNVPNAALVTALERALQAEPSGVELHFGTTAEAVEPKPERVELRISDGSLVRAKLVAGSDGRHSLCRKAAGIETTAWTYPQSAVVCSFAHSRPHNGVSTEFHRPNGPCTTVPLPGLRSSLVWVESGEEANRLTALKDAEFARALGDSLQGLLGTIGEVTPRAQFPLSGLSATTLGARRICLIGEAAHVIPPIGAQGLNLGMRDAATLADYVSGQIAAGQDPGSEEVTANYARARAPDVNLRLTGIDLLNRSLLANILPVHLLRGLGLYALSSVGPLRRWVVKEGLQPSSSLPSLMRPVGDGNGTSA